MGRAAKSSKGKAQPNRPPIRKAPKKEAARVRDLENRLAEALTREAGALEQQTASSEILRVISNSPTDIQPVFEAIAQRAVRLCGALFSSVYRFDGELIHMVAHDNYPPAALERSRQLFPARPSRQLFTARAILERGVVHIPNVLDDTEWAAPELRQAAGFRSVLAVPMIRRGNPIGAITVWHAAVAPFSQKHIELLQTFADQAVIAIENVRLFKELEARNRDLTTTLDQQTATSDILKVISSSPTDVQPVFDAIVRAAVRLCHAVQSNVQLFDGQLMHYVAGHNIGPAAMEMVQRIYPMPPNRNQTASRAILDKAVVHVPDVLEDPEYLRELAVQGGWRSVLSVPMVGKGRPIGAITVTRMEPGLFSDTEIELLQTFADQAVIAIENVRLFNETKEALEQQTATSEILRVISGSPTDVQPVFDTIAESAARLCESFDALIWRQDGDRLLLVAHHGPIIVGTVGEFSLPLIRGTLPGRVALEGRTIQVTDLQAETTEFLESSELARRMGLRTALNVPLMREGAAIGVITLRRTEIRLFSDRQVALLQTFADQAVIAIENVRLFTELEARNRDLTTALDRQTATGEILSVISGSPTDVQPVFDTIVLSAKRLLSGFSATVTRVVDRELHLAAFTATTESGDEFLRSQYPRPLADNPLSAQVVRDRVPCFTSDTEADPRYSAAARERASARGFRSQLSAPLLREDRVIGVISVTRRQTGPFSEEEIALLKTFADQAVIAIENVRLFTELQQKNEALTQAHAQVTESLEQQTATGEILRVISSNPTDIDPVLRAVVESASRLCGAYDVSIRRLESDGLRLVAHRGAIRQPAAVVPVVRGTVAGRTVLDRRAVHVVDVQAERDEFPEGAAFAPEIGIRTMLSVPLLREGVPLGVILLRRSEVSPFSNKQIALLQTFADQAVIAIENVRLFSELQDKNRALAAAHAQVSEALTQQTATSEILRVIAGSPTDLQPVLDALVESASRLCQAADTFLLLVEGDQLRVAALHGSVEEGQIGLSNSIHRGWVAGRAVVDARTVHVEDLANADAEFPLGAEIAVRLGHRTALAMPLVRKGVPIGALFLRRREVRQFSAKEIALLQTFADQAVIAIENVRLFKELEARNRDLTEALEQQTATSEILRVISSSPTDVQPVFDAIVSSGKRLCHAEQCFLAGVDGETLTLLATDATSPDAQEALHRAFPYRANRTGIAGRAVLDRRVHHIPDVMKDREYAFKHTATAADYRAMVAIPMFREAEVIGVLVAMRTAPGPFSEAQIALLQTFADQAVIAIENVRLFKELEARNTELTETLARQMATGEVLRAISQAQTDAQPVFEIIAASARRLCGAAYAQVQLYDGELIHLAALESANPEGDDAIRAVYPLRVGDGSAGGRAIATRAVTQIPDLLDDRAYAFTSVWQASGLRSLLAVPMLRDGAPVGVIGIGRTEPGLFPHTQIDLLQTFADQAVIAIENVRLFKELEARNRDLIEALEQQTATSEILRVISSSPTDVQPVFAAIADSAFTLCSAQFVVVFTLDNGILDIAAMNNISPVGIEALRRAYPMPVGSTGAASRSALTGRVINIPDVYDDPDYGLREVAQAMEMRSIAAVPMIRNGQVIGVITVPRAEPGGLTDQQVGLLQTFADQAVIAIENVRLFTELQEKNRALTEAHARATDALEQQTATSEILRVISSSPTDVRPVFDAVVKNAARLCEATFASLHRFDGQVITFDVHHGMIELEVEGARRIFPQPASRETAVGRALLDRRIAHIYDIRRDPDYRVRPSQEEFRTVLAVPLLRDGAPVGAIGLWRREVRPFSDQQIELVKTFAEQAVIAIENVRLFTELEGKNRALAQALEQQTATSEILRVISSSPTDVQPVFEAIAESAVRLCEADDAEIYRVDRDVYRRVAHRGPVPIAGPMGETYPISRARPSSRAIIDRQTIHVHDLAAEIDTEFPDLKAWRQLTGVRTILATPLLREGVAVGVILIRRTEFKPFSDKHIELLQTFADQAVIAIENVRLFTELQASNRELTTALDTQTATSDILRVISRSQTDVQPVFDAIVASALRLLRAYTGALTRVEGDQVVLVALTSTDAAADAVVSAAFPQSVQSAEPHARVVRERTPLNIADAQTDSRLTEPTRAFAHARGFRSWVVVPLLRQAEAVGAIAVTRREPGGFTDDEIALLKTFADQAVIAIENVRLFKELEARTQELTRSVGELRALSEVGQAISSTLDLQTVLSTIVARATQLTGVDAGVIYEYDEQREVFEPRATERLEGDIVRMLVATPVRKGQGATGRLAEVSEPIQLAELRDIAEQIPVRDVLLRAGYRALLAVPLVREDHLIGGLTVFRKTPGGFAPDVVELLKTFATQSALAIQNARLFREIEQKSRELEAASRHKSEFLANMSHELRTPLNAIIGFSEVLSEGMFGEINDKQTEYLGDILESGRHLLSLINDILDLSKIEAGRMELEATDFDLPSAVENALILVRERAGRRGITLGREIDERLGEIRADERKVKQVLLNLLSNALKFTPEGGRIDVRAGLHDDLAEISVTDTGVGIAPEDQEAVFEEFRQVGTAARKVEGTGLGLALSRKFIELHGGKIWVKSQVGVGSTFTFTLPVRPRAVVAGAS